MNYEEIVDWLKKHPNCPIASKEKDWQLWGIAELAHAAFECGLSVDSKLTSKERK